MSPRPLLLVHGESDEVLSSESSKRIFDWAQEPKELKLYPGLGHGLREEPEEVQSFVSEWICDHLYMPGERDLSR